MRRLEYIDRSLLSLQEQFHIDLLIFSYYAGGMLLRDMAYLTTDKIEGEFLNCESTSCPKCLKLRMSTQFLEIVDRYKDQPYSDYLLPIFTPKHDSQQKQNSRLKQLATSIGKTLCKIEAITGYNGLTYTRKHTTDAKRMTRRKQFTVRVNATLKKVCSILDIKEKITWYSARGSFISKMVDDGYSPYVVAEMAGNSTMVIFKHYYKNTKGGDMLQNLNASFR